MTGRCHWSDDSFARPAAADARTPLHLDWPPRRVPVIARSRLRTPQRPAGRADAELEPTRTGQEPTRDEGLDSLAGLASAVTLRGSSPLQKSGRTGGTEKILGRHSKE